MQEKIGPNDTEFTQVDFSNPAPNPTQTGEAIPTQTDVPNPTETGEAEAGLNEAETKLEPGPGPYRPKDWDDKKYGTLGMFVDGDPYIAKQNEKIRDLQDPEHGQGLIDEAEAYLAKSIASSESAIERYKNDIEDYKNEEDLKRVKLLLAGEEKTLKTKMSEFKMVKTTINTKIQEEVRAEQERIKTHAAEKYAPHEELYEVNPDKFAGLARGGHTDELRAEFDEFLKAADSKAKLAQAHDKFSAFISNYERALKGEYGADGKPDKYNRYAQNPILAGTEAQGLVSFYSSALHLDDDPADKYNSNQLENAFKFGIDALGSGMVDPNKPAEPMANLSPDEALKAAKAKKTAEQLMLLNYLLTLAENQLEKAREKTEAIKAKHAASR